MSIVTGRRYLLNLPAVGHDNKFIPPDPSGSSDRGNWKESLKLKNPRVRVLFRSVRPDVFADGSVLFGAQPVRRDGVTWISPGSRFAEIETSGTRTDASL